MSTPVEVPDLVITIDYLERYGSWCAVLECPPGCDCGDRKIVHGFASRDGAEAAAAELQAGWPSSPEADLLRQDLKRAAEAASSETTT